MVEEPLRGASKAVRDAAEMAEEENPHVAEELLEVSDSLSELAGADRSPDQRRIHGHRETLRELHGETLNEDARVHLERALGELSALYEPTSSGTVYD